MSMVFSFFRRLISPALADEHGLLLLPALDLPGGAAVAELAAHAALAALRVMEPRARLAELRAVQQRPDRGRGVQVEIHLDLAVHAREQRLRLQRLVACLIPGLALLFRDRGHMPGEVCDHGTE